MSAASVLDSEEWGLLQRGVTSMNPTPAASITIRQATEDDVPLIL